MKRKPRNNRETEERAGEKTGNGDPERDIKESGTKEKAAGFRGDLVQRVVAILIILTGLVLLLYPWISNWIYERRAESLIDTVQSEMDDLYAEEADAYMEEAREYNAVLTQSQVMLTDPFIADQQDEYAGDYDEMLDYNTSGVMGYIDIPSIDVYLPVYHGTDANTLLAGVGHLEGSSLPVGGENTHAVLTGHTGLTGAKLFTDLTELEIGDYFFFHILGETLAYQVVDIQVVLPEETDGLRVQDGRDLMTLLTCTPYGVNTHRLYVTGARTDYEEEIYEEAQQKSSSTGSLWMRSYRNALLIGLAIVAALAALIAVISAVREMRTNRRKDREKNNT